ncbi:SDR family NAD(P)-dependent oxidoreductase [Cyanobium sp. Morenito 9A2]|uniref:SDR family NAD(P)-dependent oxidoreductase n=1 Tax=Cyanobium sp. Morenito 9A2 TaxID=2823718 RepID=UPI0020CEF276|nr:glucose 1-dehydrogenase [Cyanobium sp. Morenito 9A2]MCP9849819.1 glucose 1-dehydrogenase [Cyanobium sp. Morenito 9A2]
MTPASPPLEGKIALVTGASRGIGAAIALHLAEAGASVVVNYAAHRNGAERIVRSIRENGGQAMAVQADVGKGEDVERLFLASDRAFGGELDVLVNNAGVYYATDLQDVTPAVFDHLFRINVLGVILCCQAAAHRFPQMGGSIINISSLAATKGATGSLVYSATKGAIDALTRTLSQDLAPRNIRVNAINPGLVITEGTRTAGFTTAALEEQWKAKTALGRVATPDDIAPVVLFLASSASRWLTGETIHTTGGVR